MISQTELPDYLEKELPELSPALHEQGSCKNAYQAMRHLLDYTNSKISEQNFRAIKKCFSIADKAYSTGNNVVKNAIENVYIYSFSHFLFKDEGKRRILIGMMPATLFTLYMRQMINSHI